MSRAKGDPSPDRPLHHGARKVTLKQRGETNLKQRADFLKLPKDKDSKSDNSADTPSKGAHHQHNIQYENSYKMVPDENKEFVPFKVENLMKDILKEKLRHEKYNADNCSKLSQQLCTAIKEKAKQIGFHRYKLVTQVLLGQDTDQSVQMASRCLWNQTTDNFAAATYRNNSLYVIAIVYGVYLD